MNHVKSALLSGHRGPHHLAASASAAAAPHQLSAAASFHSTLPLQRKRKTQWQHRFSYYEKRRKNRESKRTMLRNMSEYAEYLFQSWRDEDDKNDESSGPSWFRGHRWVDLNFAQAMRMNQKQSFAMLFVGTRHFLGLLTLMIFIGEISDILVLIQKVSDVGVMRLMMRMKHPCRERYLWHGRHLIPDMCTQMAPGSSQWLNKGKLWFI
uniref:Uncharacterized protein n=1 Tax=Leersia perrieri TaxID=77586 RepID=A0A0D9WYN9_9ORYZ